jgi:hypothetical protein
LAVSIVIWKLDVAFSAGPATIADIESPWVRGGSGESGAARDARDAN